MSDTHSAEWLLAGTSTVYMSGKAVYHLRRYGRPGIIASVELFAEEALGFQQSLQEHDDKIRAEAWAEGYERGQSDHCDYWGSEPCDVASHNPYLQPLPTIDQDFPDTRREERNASKPPNNTEGER